MSLSSRRVLERLFLAGFGLIAWLLAACQSPTPSLTVGYKSFTEQRILAHMLSRLAEEAGYKVQLYECDNTDRCAKAMQAGRVDLMVEYSGTGELYAPGNAVSAEELSSGELVTEAGIEWFVPLGFGNSYELVVSAALARERGLRSLEDLATLDMPLRLATPSEFLKRPGDGLGALVRRYGLRRDSEAMVVEATRDRMQAVRDGRAEVAVVYSTDLSEGSGLVALSDPLDFFPEYEATVLLAEPVRSDAGLRRILKATERMIDNKRMVAAIRAVEAQGFSAQVVAERMLSELGLLGTGREQAQAAIAIAANQVATGAAASEQALAAVRAVFHTQPVELVRQDDPKAALLQQKARFAVLGGEDFFDGAVAEQELEAIAVVGARYLHVLRRADDGAHGLAGAVALPRNEREAQLVRAVVPSAKRKDLRPMLWGEAKAALVQGQVDAIAVFRELGDEALAAALQSGLRLQSVAPSELNLSAQAAYLHPARMPAHSYQGQERPLDSVATQIVLAARALPPARGTSADALTGEERSALAMAAASIELPERILPQATTEAPKAKPATAEGGVLPTLLNLFTIAFLVGCVMLLRRDEVGEDLDAR